MTCPLCGAEAEAAFTTSDRNRALSRERFAYSRCTACGTYFLAQVPPDLGRYYPQEYYEVADPGRVARIEAPRLALIARYVSGGRLIEIGPGPGHFARAAREAGFEVTGIEMDAQCCARLERDGVTAIHTEAPEQALAALAPARAIAMWHVVEHLEHPWAVLEAAAARLEPGGVLAVAMPNPQSLQFRLLRGRWAHVDAPRHLFLIPYPALRSRLEELGLEVREVTSSDAVSRALNGMGWEFALRRFPARHPGTRPTRGAAGALTLALAPFERRGLGGAAYTVIAVRPDR
jgi:2-polyprenyl-3-methyl-5-hydroxy-6-metoxy-1,4-benzoquinol methylase